jgi:tetratricopeptide (TPR) repeat protein
MSDAAAAIARLEAALTVADGAAGRYELGGLKLAHGDVEGAIASYQRCLELAAPAAPAAVYNNLGTAFIKAHRFEAAIEALEAALTLQPQYLRALVNLGKALCEIGRIAEALARLEEAVEIHPDYPPALINLGDAHAAAGDYEAAECVLERALRLAPQHVEAHMSLGVVRMALGRTAESLAELRVAVALAPDHPDAHMSLAHGLFAAGEWQAAWPHFEHRLRRMPHRAPLRPPPGIAPWDGQVSSSLELWLVGEQGLGDQLQFARYARVLTAQGIACALACDRRIVKMLELGSLGCRVVPFDCPVEATVRDTMRWMPLMSAAHWHCTRRDNVPWAAGYLAADAASVERWQARLPPTRSTRVALAWAGNPRMETGRHVGRSPPLAALAPLFGVPDIEFVSLQRGPGEDQLDRLPFGRSILRWEDLDSGTDAFLDSAAVLTRVDLLVTSDSAIAHLAGALGVPTWLCLMREPDWRWLPADTKTPWYDSMRIFRQPSPGDWAGVYRDVAAALATVRIAHAQLESRRGR